MSTLTEKRISLINTLTGNILKESVLEALESLDAVAVSSTLQAQLEPDSGLFKKHMGGSKVAAYRNQTARIIDDNSNINIGETVSPIKPQDSSWFTVAQIVEVIPMSISQVDFTRLYNSLVSLNKKHPGLRYRVMVTDDGYVMTASEGAVQSYDDMMSELKHVYEQAEWRFKFD